MGGLFGRVEIAFRFGVPIASLSQINSVYVPLVAGSGIQLPPPDSKTLQFSLWLNKHLAPLAMRGGLG